jgi:hypothetical protein
MRKMNMTYRLAVVALVTAGLLGCSSELSDSGAPVELVVTNTPILSLIDLAGGEECDQNVGTINMQVFAKNANATGSFVQVRVNRYRVSYRRIDGGTQVPSSFVRPVDTLISVGASGSLSQFTVIEGDALLQAPFAALLPQNGGRDPETGRPVVKMEVIVEIFGETLGGDNVYDSTSFPLDFCYACGGCD